MVTTVACTVSSMYKYAINVTYSKTQETLNTRNIHGILLCSKEKPIRCEKTNGKGNLVCSFEVCFCASLIG